MIFMIWGVSTVMTVNVKVGQATHETPVSPCGGRGLPAKGQTTAS